jgi:hypothetical protein
MRHEKRPQPLERSWGRLLPAGALGAGDRKPTSDSFRRQKFAGPLESRLGAAALLAGIAARIEATKPLPLWFGVRDAGAFGDGADMNVAEIDVPAVGAVRVGASGEVGHGDIKAPSKPAHKLSLPWGSEGDEATARRGCEEFPSAQCAAF